MRILCIPSMFIILKTYEATLINEDPAIIMSVGLEKFFLTKRRQKAESQVLFKVHILDSLTPCIYRVNNMPRTDQKQIRSVLGMKTFQRKGQLFRRSTPFLALWEHAKQFFLP